MRVTKTKIETTMYDTNGKKISVVRKEFVEVDTQNHLLNREEAKLIKEHIEDYQCKMKDAKGIKSTLERVHGTKKGKAIFHTMADLIMMVEPNPVSHTPPSAAHLIWEAANTVHGEYQESKKKRQR